MARRTDKRPGKFKLAENRAGATVFVAPDLVEGTLDQGFNLYRSLEMPFQRAVFAMFLVAEVRPFADGNGRTARIMMNAELVGQSIRVLIPPGREREEDERAGHGPAPIRSVRPVRR